MDNETNALTVVPCGSPSASVVTTETGVQTEAIAARKAP
jgi:hypothetical protein